MTPPSSGEGAGLPGQVAFLNGLNAFHRAGHLHDFEDGKREFIGGHGRTPVLLVQGPPGTGKSRSSAFAVFARLQGAMRENRPYRVFFSCKTHAATDVLLKNVVAVQEKLQELRTADPKLFGAHFDARLLEVPVYRIAPNDPPPAGVVHLLKNDEKGDDEDYNADVILESEWGVVGTTPGGTYGMLKKKWPKNIFGHELCDLLVLDEASQMSLPEAIMAALPLKEDATLIVVGDHRQMPPIVKHDWDAEARRTFRQFQVYESVFDTLRAQHPPIIRFAESYRLHAAMADFLREEVYRHDGIPYHSKKRDGLPIHPVADDLAAAVLDPDYPLVVVVHDEAESQMQNPFEQALIEPVLRALADPTKYGLDATDGVGIVVPHRAQRAALQQSFPELCILDPDTGMPVRSAIDTVERFQGGERTVIIVSATESDRAYLLASSKFLLDPRRLTVALSRAKQKMILVASRSIFSLFSTDEETFANSLLWKNLLLRTCTTLLWEGEREGKKVAVWGGKGQSLA
ncbi:DEAD/DEAH box helicase [Frigoriglobus tundricola]|uniref:DEAD/DEAH box helicase n=1 Tax=Frigoriglobus tundricola TaxID=2774151 RepID=UPI001D078882|nr:ATP-binding protein [Frigoriglobus tundricola]